MTEPQTPAPTREPLTRQEAAKLVRAMSRDELRAVVVSPIVDGGIRELARRLLNGEEVPR